MRAVFLLAAVALLAALVEAHSETMQKDLLVRIGRDAGGKKNQQVKRRKGKAKRKPGKGNRNNKIKKRRQQKKEKVNKKQKGKMKEKKRRQKIRMRQQANCDSTVAENYANKATSWIAAITNIRTVMRILNIKKNSVQTSEQAKPKLFASTAEAIGKVTADGTQCSGNCDLSVCDAYDTLKKCQETAKEACTYSISYAQNTTKEETCKEDLEAIKVSCKDKNKLCCSEEDPTFDSSCKFAGFISEARKARETCKKAISTCMSLVKDAASMISSCVGNVESSNPVLSTRNTVTAETFIEDGVAYEQV